MCSQAIGQEEDRLGLCALSARAAEIGQMATLSGVSSWQAISASTTISLNRLL